MRRFLPTALLTLLSVLLAGGLTLLPGTASAARGKKKSASGTTETPKPLSAYEKLFKDKRVTTVRGFMTLHMFEGNKLYVELPDSLLGREMLLGTTIEESSDPGEGFAGQQPRDPLHVVFTRSDSLICLRRVHSDVLVEGDSLMARAVRRSNIDPVIASFPVKCKAPDGSSVFEATSFFVNGAPAMRPHDPYGINSFGGFLSTTVNYVAGCSLLSGVEAFADNVSVLSSLSFTLTTRFGGYLINKDTPYTALARRSLMLLPREVMMPRLCDSRIGTVPVAFVKFSDREQEAKAVYYACRWNLKPSDPAAFAAGKLTTPERPIVFYVDDTFPAGWYDAIRRGLLSWNAAFEKIGYRDAVQVRPYPRDDASFDPNDIKFSCVKYANTMGESLSSSARIDPRSGEILSATICIPHNVTSRIRTDLFVQLGAADPDARRVKMSPELFGKALAADVARHTGACLGLAVNYAGSYCVPVDSLRSPSFTQRYGISASIMDELPYNLVAQPGDKERGVALMQQGPGVYDEYVVDWLYRPVPGAATPEDEVAELDRRIAARRSDPMCLYTPPPVAVALDPRSMPYNLGDDPVRAAAYEFANYAYVMKHADEWIGEEDADYTFRSLVQASVMNQLYYAFVSVSANLGGVYLNEKYEGDALPTYLSVPRDLQRRALRFMLERLEDMSWLDNERLNKDVVEVVSLGEYCRDMLSDVIFKSLSTLDLSASKSDDPLYAGRCDGRSLPLYPAGCRRGTGVHRGQYRHAAPAADQRHPQRRRGDADPQVRRIGFRVRRRGAARCRGALPPGEDGPGVSGDDFGPGVGRAADAERRFPGPSGGGLQALRDVARHEEALPERPRHLCVGAHEEPLSLHASGDRPGAQSGLTHGVIVKNNAAEKPHCFFAYGYAWNLIVNFRIGLSTHIGSALQRGIHARFHQSGTMHRRPRHRARSPRRAHESAEMSTPMRRPMRCQRGVSP